MSVRILLGDCRERLRDLPDASVDSYVCDPPYHLTSIVKRFGSPGAAPAKVGKTGAYARASKGFMGQTWDGGDVAFQPETWAEVLRVLKPGAHLVAFSGTRTYHRMVCAIEDAGFEIRDQLAWVYGSGFPKSLDVSKQIDKTAGHWRGRAGDETRAGASFGQEYQRTEKGDPVTAAAAAGWGTALKPAWEPIVLARRPLAGTVAANFMEHGTGALNIDGCRIGFAGNADAESAKPGGRATGKPLSRLAGSDDERSAFTPSDNSKGRWPANIIHDGSDEVVAHFPETDSGGGPAAGTPRTRANTYGEPTISRSEPYGPNSGSAARFFYCAKAAPEERGESNNHPTVKPVALMRWLARLVTPKGGTVLDPFLGSGSTALACDAEQFNFIGCELSADYAAIAEQRIRRSAGMFADISVEHSGPATRSAA